MTKRCLIYLTIYGWSARDDERFGLEHFKSQKIDIFICNYNMPSINSENFKSIFEILNFNTPKAFEKCMEELTEKYDTVTLISQVNLSLSTLRVFAKFNIIYGHTCQNSIPTHSNTPSLNGRIGKIYYLRTQLGRIWYYAKYLRNSFLAFIGIIKMADFVFLGGQKSLLQKRTYASIGPKTKNIWVHSLDYDQYLDVSQKHIEDLNGFKDICGIEISPQTIKGTILFLDQYFPFHSDFKKLNIPSPVMAEDYYPAMCHFFTQIEAFTGKTVIIAAHPQSDYEQRAGLYGKRTLIKGRTKDLMQLCDLTINHYSTAISFSAFFQKKLLLVCPDFMMPRYQLAVKIFSLALNLPFLYLPKINYKLSDTSKKILSGERMPDYKDYIELYIKTKNSKNDYSWNIVLQELMGIDVVNKNEHE